MQASNSKSDNKEFLKAELQEPAYEASNDSSSNIHFELEKATSRHAVQKLFVSYLPEDCSEQKLGDLFKTYGEVVKVTIPDSVTGRKTNYAMVEMKNPAEAASAMDSLSNHKIDGCALCVTPAIRPE